MTPREKFIMALEGKQPPGRVPHTEIVFYLTMEAFGRIQPNHRYYKQWNQMSQQERDLHSRDMVDLYVAVARKYEHCSIFLAGPTGLSLDDLETEHMRQLEIIRELSGMDFFLMTHGDATWWIPQGDQMMEFAGKLADEPQEMKDQADRMVDEALVKGRRFRKHGVIDGFALCTDYCYNDNPFLSPTMFDEFVTPYLTRLIAGYRRMGFYVIKHTDGNIMPILDSLVAANPHAIHSLDPQAGVDIAEVKRLVGHKVCLMGNVNCGLLHTGTDEEVIESARYALKSGMPGGGYVFCTSNSPYTGMPLERYELMLDVWRKEGNYD
jgi:uroporphyrinogen decarboxylase